ncbi:MAG: 2Fe-2S iron-sulfur cluster-binding protein, partial [Actinomycetota bacterium]
MNEGPARVTLAFEPAGKSVRVPSGVSVFDAALWNGVPVDSTCGGHGTCKKCKVRIADGSVPISRLDERAFTAEQLADGWRLACMANADTNLTVDVPEMTTRPKAATVGVGRQVILRPAVQKRLITLEEPTLSDQRTDIRRVLDALDDLELTVDPLVLRTLGTVLRQAKWTVTAVVVGTDLVAIEPGDTTASAYGIAFDLGTTTAVGTLMDLTTGAPIAVASMLNQQQPFGADVISRISATMLEPVALERLRDCAHSTLNELAQDVCEQAGISPDQVYEVALAGNATMAQLALGIDPEPLGVAPFILATESYEGLLASDLGVRVHPRARAMLFPHLGAYVGGDIIA